jgi:hypothetical protein
VDDLDQFFEIGKVHKLVGSIHDIGTSSNPCIMSLRESNRTLTRTPSTFTSLLISSHGVAANRVPSIRLLKFAHHNDCVNNPLLNQLIRGLINNTKVLCKKRVLVVLYLSYRSSRVANGCSKFVKEPLIAF